MALGLVNLNIEYYPDPTQGRPVFNGSVYVGRADLDPVIEANRVTVHIRQEGNPDVPILPAAQPLVTSPGGVIIYNGSPAQLLVEGNYSIKVLNNIGTQVYYVANAFSNAVDTTSGIVVPDKSTANSLTIINGKKVFITSPDGGDFIMRTGAPIGTYNDDDVTYTGTKFTNGDGSEGLERMVVNEFNVVWFGAMGNTSVVDIPPIVDDTNSIISTINAARLTDKNVRIPSGNYLVTDTINFYSGINIYGSGKGGVSNGFAKRVGATTITFNPDTSKDLFVSNQEAPTTSHDQFCSITGIRVIGGASGGNANIGINLNKLIYCAFRDLTISGFNTGLYCKGTINNRFENVYIDTCSLSCVLIDSTATTDVFDQCTFFGATIGCILNDSIGIRFLNCIWEQNLDYGLIANDRCENITVIAGYCEDVPYSATQPDAAMFNLGRGGGPAVIGNVLTVIGGVYSGNNTGNIGSFMDVDYADGILVSDVSHSRYINIFKTTANTKDKCIVVNGSKGISWTTHSNDVAKISGLYDPRTVDVSTGANVRVRDAFVNQIASDTAGGDVNIVSPLNALAGIKIGPTLTWTPVMTIGANCTNPAVSTAKYFKVGNMVTCQLTGTVDITEILLDTSFTFTVPVNMDSSSDTASGNITVNWGGFGLGSIVNWTSGNANQVGAIIPSIFVGASGVQSFTIGITYISIL